LCIRVDKPIAKSLQQAGYVLSMYCHSH